MNFHHSDESLLQLKLFMTMFTPLKTSITKYILFKVTFRYSFMIIMYLFGPVLRKVASPAEAEI